jgi:hypothetical protein
VAQQAVMLCHYYIIHFVDVFVDEEVVVLEESSVPGLHFLHALYPSSTASCRVVSILLFLRHEHPSA